MEILVAELQHRTRNLIGVVRSVGSQTLSESTSLGSFWRAFSHRLDALSRVQGLLSRSDSEPVKIGSLVRSELEALGATDGRVCIEGPEVPLRNSSVQTLALALHELATNARKFGGLATPDGGLQIKWRVRDSDNPVLVLEWNEQRGTSAADQAIVPPLGQGYGRELIERALPYALGATTMYELTADRLACTIELPLRRSR